MDRSKSVVPVRVGVVGLGRFGRLHALTLAGLGDAELVGLVARRRDSLEALQRELPGVPGWTDLEQAIAESGAEAWVVACSTDQHVAVTKTLLRAGRTVLLEKPISASLADAESLAPWIAAESADLMLGHIVLFNSEFRQLGTRFPGERPAYIDCVRHRPATIVGTFRGRTRCRRHDSRSVLGAGPAGRRGAAEIRQFHRTAGGAVDLALAQIEWNSGMLASFAASYLTPGGMPPRGFDRMEVFGEGWAARITRQIRVRWRSGTIEHSGHWRRKSGPTPGPTGMMAEELRTFCRVVRAGLEGVPAGAAYEAALQTQRWMHRLEVAAEEVRL